MSEWANPWGYRQPRRDEYGNELPPLPVASAQAGDEGRAGANVWAPGDAPAWAMPYGYRPPSGPYGGEVGYNPTRPFANLSDEQQYYFSQNPGLATRSFFDAMTGGNSNSPFARWLATRESELLSKFQQQAPFLGKDMQYTGWLNGQGGPPAQQFAREWRERTPEQRGEQPWRVTRNNPWG